MQTERGGIFLHININYDRNQVSYKGMAEEKVSKSHSDSKAESETRSGSGRDTVSISVAGQQFTAEQTASDSEMNTIRITSDLDAFRSAVSSMNEPLPVSWEAAVDPYGTFRSFAKAESCLRQLNDPAASKKDEDMERVAASV